MASRPPLPPPLKGQLTLIFTGFVSPPCDQQWAAEEGVGLGAESRKLVSNLSRHWSRRVFHLLPTLPSCSLQQKSWGAVHLNSKGCCPSLPPVHLRRGMWLNSVDMFLDKIQKGNNLGRQFLPHCTICVGQNRVEVCSKWRRHSFS